MEIVGKNFRREELFNSNKENIMNSANHSHSSSNTKKDSVNYDVLSSSSRKNIYNINHFQKNDQLKCQNFIDACTHIKANNFDINSINMTMQNMSEFSVGNADLSLEDNVENYLHKPLVKCFKKNGNEIINMQCTDSKVSVNVPYNMNGIFKNLMTKIVEVDSDEEEEILSYEEGYDIEDLYDMNLNLNVTQKAIENKENLSPNQGIISNNENNNNYVSNNKGNQVPSGKNQKYYRRTRTIKTKRSW